MRKFLAVVLILVFTAISCFFIFFYGISKTFFNPDFYKSDLIDISYDFLIKEIPDKIDYSKMENIIKDDLIEILKNVFPKEQFKKDVSDIIDDIIEQLKTIKITEYGSIEFKIPLIWLKEKKSIIANEIASKIYDKSKCTESDCITKDFTKDDFIKNIAPEIENNILPEIPDEKIFAINNISQRLSANSNKSIYEQIDSFFSYFTVIYIIILIVILSLIALIIFNPWSNIVKWISIAIFFPAVTILFLLKLLDLNIENIIKSNWPDYYDFIKFTSDFFINNLTFLLTPIAFIGLVGIIVGIIFNRRNLVI